MKYKYICPNCHIRTNNFYCECCFNSNLKLNVPINNQERINFNKLQLTTY